MRSCIYARAQLLFIRNSSLDSKWSWAGFPVGSDNRGLPQKLAKFLAANFSRLKKKK